MAKYDEVGRIFKKRPENNNWGAGLFIFIAIIVLIAALG